MPSDGEWFECAECSYATNSPRRAEKHQDETGHAMIVGDDEDTTSFVAQMARGEL